MKQLEVSLLGQVYVLACPDGGEQLLQAAVQAVDREMTAIRDGGKVKARERIAVLAALNLAYQLAERAPAAGPAVAAPAAATAPADAAGIDALVRKLDAALGDDGQLL
ncbi:MAG: cell division protein ZapA [Rubrivivax sp.]|nr:cell division protein ZapA [Rubrivivax sp.]